MSSFDEYNNGNVNSTNYNPEQYGNQQTSGFAGQNGEFNNYESQNSQQQGNYYTNQPSGVGYEQNGYASQQVYGNYNGYANQVEQQNSYTEQPQTFSTVGETTVLNDVNPYVTQNYANGTGAYATQSYQGATNNTYGTQMTANNAYASNETQSSKKRKKEKKQKIKSGTRMPRFVISIIAMILVGVVISAIDNNTKNDLIGTWEYTEPTEYDEVFTVDVVWNFVLTEDTYVWEIDEEDTKENLLTFYDKLISYYELTEESVKLEGYESLADFKQKMLELDMADLGAVAKDSGMWRIEEGEFLFKRTGEDEEYRTEYKLEGDTLELLLDDIVLTRVKDTENTDK